MANPLHQFEITPLVPLHLGGLDISFTNSSLWMVAAVLVSTVFLTIAAQGRAMVPGRLQAFGESMYEFIANMVRENIGDHGRQYFPLIFSLFMMVFMGNALGMIPYAFTFTSHIVVTAALALLVFLMVCVLGLVRHGLHFFSIFLPAGVPLAVAPLIIIIEVISFFIRPVTLSVRLFANMMAGHILMKVIAGFAVAFLASLGFAGVIAGIFPTLFNVVLIGFELMIAFLQAYVFAVLCCIYLKDTVELAH